LLLLLLLLLLLSVYIKLYFWFRVRDTVHHAPVFFEKGASSSVLLLRITFASHYVYKTQHH